MSIQDIAVLILLLIGFFIGLTQSAPKKIFRVLVVVIVIVVVYFVLVPILRDWICYEVLEVMGQEIEVTYEDEVVLATTVEEIFTSLDYFGIDTDVLSAHAVAFCEIISFILLLPVAIFASLIISGLLWHIIFKRFIPKKFRKGGAISHIFGGLLGGLEMLVIIILIAASLAQISTAIDNSIMKTLNDESSSLYGVLNGTAFEDYVKVIEEYINYVSPTSDANTILPALLNMLSNMNIDYLGMFKTLTVDNGEYVDVNFADGFATSFNKVIDYISEQL